MLHLVGGHVNIVICVIVSIAVLILWPIRNRCILENVHFVVFLLLLWRCVLETLSICSHTLGAILDALRSGNFFSSRCF